MFNIIPPLLIVIGLMGLVVLLTRQKKKFSEEVGNLSSSLGESSPLNSYKLFFVRVSSLSKQKGALITTFLSRFFQKVLIRLRIIILRIDHLLMRLLEKHKEKNKIDKKYSEKTETILKESHSHLNIFKHLQAQNIASLDLTQEEKKLLTSFLKKTNEKAVLINLSRLYLFKEDFAFARWALLKVYQLDPHNKIIQDLFLELYEKEGGKEKQND